MALTQEQFDAIVSEQPELLEPHVAARATASSTPATLEELEKLSPDDPAFVLNALRAKATLEAARVQKAEAQANELATARQQIETLRNELVRRDPGSAGRRAPVDVDPPTSAGDDAQRPRQRTNPFLQQYKAAKGEGLD